MFEIKFTGDTFLEVRKEIQEFAINHLHMKFGINDGPGGELLSRYEEATPQKRKPGRHPGFSPKKKPAPAPPPVPEDDILLTSPDEAQEEFVMTHEPEVIPSEEEAQAVISKVMEKLGPDKAKHLILDGILPKFGVKRGRDLKPEQRAPFIAQCEQALR